MGKVSQSGIQRRGVFHEGPRPNGLLLRGVVLATYVTDDPNHPANTTTTSDAQGSPVAVYCDVLVYSNLPGMRCYTIPKALVLQDRGGMHDGRIWKPKAATFDVTEVPFDPDTGTQVSNMDGDHVLVGFVDNALNQPVVLGGVPHPSQGIGASPEAAVGHRRQLVVADGDPDFARHHGAFYGVDTNGDWLVDTTMAYDGTLGADGTEPGAPTDGTGSQKHLLAMDAEHRVEFFDMTDPLAPVAKGFMSFVMTALTLMLEGATLKVEGQAAAAKLTLGDGAKSALIAEAWETFFDGSFKTWLTTHTHATGVGPSAVPTEAGTFPAYASSAATSTHLKLPDA
jgi:hypothetical protein